MKRTHTTTVLVTALAAAAISGVACGTGAGAETAENVGQSASAMDAKKALEQDRQARQAAFDRYLTTNSAGFKAFKDTAVGNLGVPMVMLRLFPVLFPAIWGPPSAHFASVGFAVDPWEPTRALPLGLGYAGSTPAVETPYGPVNVNVVTLTCMGCHGGRVEGADGVVHTIPGAPNTQFDGFRTAVYATVNQPGYTAAAFRTALAAQPAGWVYNDPTMAQQEAIERAIFMSPGGAESMLAALQAGSNAGAARFEETLGSYTYASVPNPPNPGGQTPGYLDAIGAGISIIVDPAVLTPAELKAALPPYPAMIDIMSVWAQNNRPAAQWDGSILSKVHRNLAAEFGVIGSPTNVSMPNADITTEFTAAMPAPPYPFALDADSAARGEKLYGKYCASCHTTGSSSGDAKIFRPSETGTDQNRAIIWSPYTVGGLREVLSMACTDPITCSLPDGGALPGADILTPTGGYMAVPLDGIWARAPYLHNGSVPTLSALLTGDRPKTFYRGNITYNEAEVGFDYKKSTNAYAAIYDTTLSGNSNTGHLTAEFNGDVNWAKETGKLEDLLAYLKTL